MRSWTHAHTHIHTHTQSSSGRWHKQLAVKFFANNLEVLPYKTPKRHRLLELAIPYNGDTWNQVGADYVITYMDVCIYHSLMKKGPWAEHLASLPKRGVGALSTVSAFNHERAPMSCLQRLKALEANNWTQNNIQHNHQQLRSRVLMVRNTSNCTM